MYLVKVFLLYSEYLIKKISITKIVILEYHLELHAIEHDPIPRLV